MRQPTTSIVVLGDIHGQIYQAERAIASAHSRGINTILQVGDFGIWPGDGGKRFLNKLNHALRQFDIHLYFVDGNHEDFVQIDAYRRRAEKTDDGTYPVRTNIHYLPRGYRWEWHGLSFLAMGGAVSVDKHLRKPYLSWWPEEEITYADVTRAAAIPDPHADIMICHDSPSDAPNWIVDSGHGEKFFPRDALDRAAVHRQMLQAVVDAVTPYALWHGHYHSRMSGHFYTGGHICRIEGLDEGGNGIKSIMVVDLEEFKAGIDLEKERTA